MSGISIWINHNNLGPIRTFWWDPHGSLCFPPDVHPFVPHPPPKVAKQWKQSRELDPGFTFKVNKYIYIYIPTHIHTYIHTYIPTYLPTYLPNIHTLRYVTLHYMTWHDITWHDNTLHTYTHFITLQYTTLNYMTLHYITLHDMTWHDMTLHYITLHTYIHTCILLYI